MSATLLRRDIFDPEAVRDFAETMEFLFWRLFGEVQGQTREGIDRSKCAGPFLLHKHVRVDVVTFDDPCLNFGPKLMAQIV